MLRAATALALSEGDYTPLMTRTQRRAYASLVKRKARLFMVDSSRRWGKTIFAALLAFMTALGGPNRIIRYVAPTKLHGRQFVIPAFQWVAGQLPESQRPRFMSQDNTWVWPSTGSVCHLGSAESMADVEAQVGTACHRALIDEAGKMRSDLLRHLYRSVLLPQFLTTGGDIIVGSTPALTPAHYLAELVARCEASDALARYTIEDCDHVSEEEREILIAELGGRQSTEVRRELYCEHVTERSRLIIPEWVDVEADVAIEVEPAEERDWYVAADFGFEDLTVVLYAWFDFDLQRIIVEHEVAMHRASSSDVGYACKALEHDLGIKPLTRVADAPLQLLADLSHKTLGPGIDFAPTQKDDAGPALAQLRSEIGRKRVIVHPRCKTLLSHLRYGTWNERRTSFDRPPGDEYGHWDAIDALKYLNRAVNRRRNPAPVIPKGAHSTSHYIPNSLRKQAQQGRQIVLGRPAR